MHTVPVAPCDSCGKYADTYGIVLKPLPNGEKQEVLACPACVALYEPLLFCRIRLAKFPYILDKEPPFWTNDTTLYNLFDGKQATLAGRLPLDDFPLIEDFEVVLEGFVRKHLLEKISVQYTARFFSPSHGYLAHFRHRKTAQDLCQKDFLIPCGNFAAPFVEFEPGESLLIAENEECIYVLSNYKSDDAFYFPAFEDYEHNVWFKVRKERYFSQWEKAIRLCRISREKFL